MSVKVKAESKTFFHKIEPMAVLSEMILIPDAEKGQWAVRFFSDLAKNKSELASTDIARDIILRTEIYRKKASVYGKTGSDIRYGKD